MADFERVCIGYPGHACGKAFDTQGTRTTRCPECQDEWRRLTPLEYAKVRYAREFGKPSRPLKYRLPQTYCAHTLQWLMGGHFVRAVNAILAGEVLYVR